MNNTTANLSPIAVILLAAGFSRRMGQCKLVMEYRGKSLIAHVLHALANAPSFAPALAVVGPHSPQVLINTLQKHKAVQSIIVAQEAALGQAASLKAGWKALKESKAEGALILLGDQPFISSELLEALASAWHKHGGCVAPVFEGKRGNPVILDAKAFYALEQSAERESPRLALAALPWHLVEWQDNSCLRDVDTQEDYAALAGEK